MHTTAKRGLRQAQPERRRAQAAIQELMNRRLLLAAFPAALLTACGFELRRAPELGFRTLQLTGFKPGSPLAEELRRQLHTSTTTRVVESAGQAQVILVAEADAREKSVVASTAAGQVREIQVRVRFVFRLKTPADRDLLPPTEIMLSRDITYNERDALAKEYEEEQLYRAMQSDIASQVMRRLAALKL
jgi:LPS-assembly lipoprotein